uniref:Uncharacterized protein n=1 Tax=Meloidogyne enterolobii TaxID=390850 RepID=A0A6V7WG30_MELEN|nr:unnamed protein product [Meloidogyne enterolobii]
MSILNFLQIAAFIIFSIQNSVNSIEGVAISEYASTENFKCLKENFTIKFVIVSAAKNGTIDDLAKNNIRNAYAAGIEDVDIKITINFVKPRKIVNRTPREIIISILNELNKNNLKIGKIWFDIAGDAGMNNANRTYRWYEDKERNIKFIEEMIEILKENNKLNGIYSSKSHWTSITGNTQKFKEIPLWYNSFDEINNFNDYTNKFFGGWKYPYVKTYDYRKDVIDKSCGTRPYFAYCWKT